MMNLNFLIITCGLPASGKSTFAEKLEKVKLAKRVCPDRIRAELYGDENIQGNGNKVFKIAFDRIEQYGKENKSVVFDATNITRKGRKRLIKKYKEFFDFILCYYFDTPIEICLERNAERNRQVRKDIIYNMHERLQIPDINEGFDYVEILKNY